MTLRSLTDRRAPAPAVEPQCTHCHEQAAGRVRVIGGVGLRTLCEECELKLVAMGFTITEERRHG